MTYQKIKQGIFIGILIIGILCPTFKALQLAAAEDVASDHLSPLESFVGASKSSHSTGLKSGELYSLDGKPLTKKDGNKVSAINESYTILGDENSGGALYKLQNILESGAAKANKEQRKGNDVQSTIISKGQEVAFNELAKFNGIGSICIVGRDGSVRVSTQRNIPEDKKYIDFNASADFSMGSVMKPIVYRVLLKNNDKFDKEYSLYNDKFHDIPEFNIDGSTIHNWDSGIPSYYPFTSQDGDPYRKTNFADALNYSSNTYLLRHANALGINETNKQLLDTFPLEKKLVTEINTIKCRLPDKQERMTYFLFGQDLYISPVMLCEMYNFNFSGDWYSPFYVSAVYEPGGKMIYKANPKPSEEYTMKIDPDDDLLTDGLNSCFDYYLSKPSKEEFRALIDSGRVLCKSGTAEAPDNKYNSTMVMTVLSEDRSTVIASGCIALRNLDKKSQPTNEARARALINTMRACDII